MSQKIRLSGEGIDRFRVFIPFLFDDGAHLVIVLMKEGTRWVLSDEVHTCMHACNNERCLSTSDRKQRGIR